MIIKSHVSSFRLTALLVIQIIIKQQHMQRVFHSKVHSKARNHHDDETTESTKCSLMYTAYSRKRKESSQFLRSDPGSMRAIFIGGHIHTTYVHGTTPCACTHAYTRLSDHFDMESHWYGPGYRESARYYSTSSNRGSCYIHSLLQSAHSHDILRQRRH